MRDKNVCKNIKLCPIQKTLNIIGGKWKINILWYLKDNILRTSELNKLLPEISQKMLINQLKEFEKDLIISRKVYPVVPPKLEYILTKKGLTLIPILNLIRDWGEKDI